MTPQHLRAVRTAQAVVEDYGIRAPEDIDLEAIAYDRGVVVIDGNLSGSWARLVRKGKRGVVRVSDSIPYAGQRRFCIAHELGHFLLHADWSQLALCSNEDMLPGYASGSEEPEANAFAGEFLMPEPLFRKRLNPVELSFDVVAGLADVFQASMSATIHRIVDVAEHVCALVRSEKGVLRSFHRCSDFPFRIREMGTRLDARSCAGEFYLDGTSADQEADVLAETWLEDDRLMGDELIREITVPMPRFESAVTLLWIVPGSSLDYLAAE